MLCRVLKVSTLLEILGENAFGGYCGIGKMFQPFLRFWRKEHLVLQRLYRLQYVSTLLEILAAGEASEPQHAVVPFQPFLRFWEKPSREVDCVTALQPFQPFLRFWGLCVWFLWVFKFFFGFL